MVASDATFRLEDLAQNVLDVVTQLGLATPRSRRQPGELKEIEFLTLSLLHQQESLIVGDIQRHLGVLPAQMSRIIRSLEARDRPLIACRINPRDKRKIDVALTAAGVQAFQEYQTLRLQNISSVLTRLAEDDLEQINRLLERLNELLPAVPAR